MVFILRQHDYLYKKTQSSYKKRLLELICQEQELIHELAGPQDAMIQSIAFLHDTNE